MKISKIFQNKIFKYSCCFVLCGILGLVSCLALNFVLVPSPLASTIEVIMDDAKSQTKDIDIVFCGSSRTYRGIDSVTLSTDLDANVFNIAYENANFYSSYHLLVELFKTKEISKLFLEVSTTNFTRGETTEDSLIYRILTGDNQEEFATGLALDYLDFDLLNFTNYMENFSNGRFISNIKQKLGTFTENGERINKPWSIYSGNGYLKCTHTVSQNAELLLPQSYFHNGEFWDDEFVDEVQFEYFEKILRLCNENGIEVFLYSPPYPYCVIDDYGSDLEIFDNYVEGIATHYDLEYLNFSKIRKEYMRLENKYFYNANHCNEEGAKALEPIVKDIIEQMEQGVFVQENMFYTDYQCMIEDYQN